MEKDLQDRLDQLEFTLQRIEKMTRRMYRVFLATVIGSVVLIVVPLIILAYVLPGFISTFSSTVGEIQGVSGLGL
jgi:type II secretory pathway component PulF